MSCLEAKIYYIYCDHEDCDQDMFIPSVAEEVPLPVGWKAIDVKVVEHGKVGGFSVITRYLCPNHAYKELHANHIHK